MSKFLMMCLFGIVSCSAFADSFGDARAVMLYPLHADTLPEFAYSAATSNHPILVSARSMDGKCKFTISLWGVQQDGKIRDVGLVGRTENGTCNGVDVHEGLVRASVTFNGDKAVLDNYLEVIVLK